MSDAGQARDTSVRQFVTKSFNALSTQILKAALGKRSSHEEGDSSLVSTIKSTLTSQSNILLVACASPSPQFFDHALPAVKFCARIRETILRKLSKRSSRVQEQRTPKNPLSNAKQTRFKLDVAAAVVNADNMSMKEMDTGSLLHLFPADKDESNAKNKSAKKGLAAILADLPSLEETEANYAKEFSVDSFKANLQDGRRESS